MTGSHPSFLEGGHLDELYLQRLQDLTGRYVTQLLSRFAGISEEPNKTTVPARILRGGVRRTYTFAEARGQRIGSPTGPDLVWYFNGARLVQYATSNWRSIFADKPVICDSPVQRVPQLFWDAPIPTCSTRDCRLSSWRQELFPQGRPRRFPDPEALRRLPNQVVLNSLHRAVGVDDE